MQEYRTTIYKNVLDSAGTLVVRRVRLAMRAGRGVTGSMRGELGFTRGRSKPPKVRGKVHGGRGKGQQPAKPLKPLPYLGRSKGMERVKIVGENLEVYLQGGLRGKVEVNLSKVRGFGGRGRGWPCDTSTSTPGEPYGEWGSDGSSSVEMESNGTRGAMDYDRERTRVRGGYIEQRAYSSFSNVPIASTAYGGGGKMGTDFVDLLEVDPLC
ncbi:hypothetical protein C8R45DRAFT_945563 [Mycena sanguinolenta]|nr:hypothetical protein C8R45DRAFT_945563 [Mycena sanguinolenta]